MNKAELVACVAEKTGFTKKDAEAAVNAFISCVEETLVKGEKYSSSVSEPSRPDKEKPDKAEIRESRTK